MGEGGSSSPSRGDTHSSFVSGGIFRWVFFFMIPGSSPSKHDVPELSGY